MQRMGMAIGLGGILALGGTTAWADDSLRIHPTLFCLRNATSVVATASVEAFALLGHSLGTTMTGDIPPQGQACLPIRTDRSGRVHVSWHAGAAACFNEYSYFPRQVPLQAATFTVSGTPARLICPFTPP